MVTSGQEAREPWPASYTCLLESEWVLGSYALRPIQFEDRVAIREWRNAQIEVLRQAHPLTVEGQRAYFTDVVRPQLLEEKPDQVLMTLWFDGAMVGYGGLVHIDWFHERAELSFLVDPIRIATGCYEMDFLTFLELIARVARDDLALHRLTGETFPERTEHVRIFEAFGFVCEGRLVQHRRVGSGYGDSLVHGLLLDSVGT